jgi:regulator of protease activity HflC (stomatin/prohibitin superfamily)
VSRLLISIVTQHLHEACAAWGLVVTRYEVTAVDADAKIAESMDLQAAAERKRRETVKSAMAEKEAVILESEGQRERDKNESDGQRIRAITEGDRFFLVLFLFLTIFSSDS